MDTERPDHDGVIRDIVFSDNAQTIAKFKARFGTQIEEAIASIGAAQKALDEFRSSLTGDIRVATVDAFLHSAVYSLTAALHHLVTGYGIGCGHMMRHVYESLAMAALCCDKECQVLEEFTKNRRRYPVDEAPSRLRRPKIKKRLAPLLGIDPDVWAKHLDQNVDFSGRSHATGLTLAFQVMLETDDQMVIGGEYDPGKDHAYDSDLRRIKSLANDIAAITPQAAAALKALQSR